MKSRCLSEAIGGTSGCELEEIVRRENGAGMFQTAAGEITRCIASVIPPKLLDMIRLDPRSAWPLALFTSLNLEKCGSHEGYMVKVQLANGVVHTKSTVNKLVERWETPNDILEPLRRYASVILIFDPVYGQVLNGILAVVTRELIYQRADGQVKPSDVHRLQLYVDIVRSRYGGSLMLATGVHKFFQYDSALGQEAQRALEDLTKETAKEDAKTGGDLKDLKKNCTDYNKAGWCAYNTSCKWIHKCLQCGGKHPVKDCTKKAVTK
jgi:hypothetical protein